MIVILGPTASGKTNLAVKIANELDGEIISADSRQIYKGMDIGTGKDLNEYCIKNKKIPYHLIDILNPHTNYSVFNFQKDFNRAFNSIKSQNKLPILCGGTGLYIESILLNYKIGKSSPDIKLRESLKNKSAEFLIKKIKSIPNIKYDSNYHATKRRMIRAIELSKNPQQIDMNAKDPSLLENALVLGIKIDRSIVLEKIKDRLEKRIQEGMIEEVENLIKEGVSIERLQYFGLEYRYIAKYLDKEITYTSMVNQLNYAINRFSKRQMTFFRRMEKRGIKINWVQKENYQAIQLLMNNFLADN